MNRRLKQVPKGVMQKQAKGFKNHGTQKLKLKKMFSLTSKVKICFSQN